MNRRLRNILLITLSSAVVLSAQEKTGTPEKKEPEGRRVELPTSLPNPQQNPSLPKIELPEFVITGIASLNVPDVQKEEVVGVSRLADLSAYKKNFGIRERETVELEDRQKEFLSTSKSPVLNGQVVASLGNYFTPSVNFWLGKVSPEYDYRFEAGYHRTKGYAPNTDRSGGNLGVKGGLTFTSGGLQGGRLGGDAAWGTENYRFFGSITPTARRTHSNVLVGASVESSPSRAFTWNANLGYRFDTIDDSGVETRQHRVNLGTMGEYSFSNWALQGTLKYHNASLSGANSGTVSMLNFGLGTSRYWWNKFFLQGAAHLYVAKGMVNQNLTRIYPDVSVGYSLGDEHLVSISYAGSVEFLELASAFEAHPYLAANSLLRHTDRSRQVLGAVESDWSPSLRTKFSVSYEYINDYPLYADPFNTGIWQLSYAGKTRLWNIRAEGFAKLTPNDYVSAKVSVNSSKNNITQLSVPYLPEFEIVGSYTHAFPFGLNVSPRASYQHQRETDLTRSQKLPGVFQLGLHADYEPLTALRVFLDLHNITNKRYELWRGYQAPPFLVKGGVSFRW